MTTTTAIAAPVVGFDHAYAALGQAIEQSRAPHAQDVGLLAVFFVLFAGGAARLYRKDTLKA